MTALFLGCVGLGAALLAILSTRDEVRDLRPLTRDRLLRMAERNHDRKLGRWL